MMCSGGSSYDDFHNFHNAVMKSRPTEGDAKEAAVSLARLMERQLGYPEGRIDNVALRLFIRAYWSRVAAYAHTIHDSP